MIGGLSDLTCFSFHAVKNLATGDGGMVTTNDKNWPKLSKDCVGLGSIRKLGSEKSWCSKKDTDNMVGTMK